MGKMQNPTAGEKQTEIASTSEHIQLELRKAAH